MAKRGRPPGSPILANRERIDRLISEIKRGNFLRTACSLAGISESAVYSWLEKAEVIENKKDPNSAESQLIEFRKEYLKAEGEALDTQLQFILSDTDWKARQWYLQHRYPDIFTNQPVKFEGKFKGETTLNVPPEILKALGDMIVKRRSGSPAE